MADWFADDSFWAETHEFERRYGGVDTGDAEVEQTLRLIGTQQGHVLDLPCGVGRHAIPFAKRGFTVTAVDLSAFHLAKAKEHAATAGASIEFVHSDIRSVLRPNTFDLVVSLSSSFGYFEDPQDDLKVLRQMQEARNRVARSSWIYWVRSC
jgi:2-polyprenyl-3-methyl-5-hydroxy-6-metoxy-1,4-benzoquinol methylase